MTQEHRSHEADALAEVLNIGMGNALSALGILLPGERFDLSTASAHFTERHQAVAGTTVLSFELEGFFSARLCFVCDPASDAELARLVLAANNAPETYRDSALQEVGNILASAFAGAVGRLTGEVVLPSPPMLTREAAACGGASDPEVEPCTEARAQHVERMWQVENRFTLGQGPTRVAVCLLLDHRSGERLLDALPSNYDKG